MESISNTSKIRLGIPYGRLQSRSTFIFEIAFTDSPYIDAISMHNHHEATQQLTAGAVRGLVIIQPDFAKRLKQADGWRQYKLLLDGAETNTANFG